MIPNSKSINNLDSFLSSAGLYIQLFPGVYLSDLIRINYKEDLSINLVQAYLQYSSFRHISENESEFKFAAQAETNLSRAILMFQGWRMAVFITDSSKTAFLVGKDWSRFSLTSVIPADIQVNFTQTPSNLHISYYIVAIARHTVLFSPDCSNFNRIAQEACEIRNVEATVQDVISFIYSNSLKSKQEIESYLNRYNEVLEQDSLNYSSSDELSFLDSIAGKTSKMSEWIGKKMKNNLSESESSVIQFDTLNPEMIKGNPFDLASSIEDKSSYGPPTISVDDIIDSTFVNSLLELGNRKKTIIMQVEDNPESCHCGLCPIY